MMNLSYNNLNDVLNIFEKIKDSKEINSKNEEFIKKFHLSLTTNITLQAWNENERLAYTEKDFENVAKKVLPYLQCMHRIIEEIILLSDYCTLSSEIIKLIAKDSVLVSQFIKADKYWSDEECSTIANNIIDSLIAFSKSKTLTEFLVGKENVDSQFDKTFPNGVVKLCLDEFSQIFTKEMWKKHPSMIDAYSWMLFNIQSPQLSEYIVYFLPPALLLLDDWEKDHKLLGIKSLNHIIQNTPNSELRWYGRAEVIFDALDHNLYTKDPEILESVYPAAISAAFALEKDPKYSSSITKKYYDAVIGHLLREMNYEQVLRLRTVYAKALKQLVDAMGLFALRWSVAILEVCSNYLETFEGELAQDRLVILETLEIFITYCWPRIHFHAENILKMILKLVYEINVEDSKVINKEAVLQQSKNVCDLLLAAAPQRVRELCEGLEDLEINHKSDILYIIGDVFK